MTYIFNTREANGLSNMAGRGRIKDIARQRIARLYALATDAVRKGEKEFARRYVRLAIEISHKAAIRPPLYFRRGYCRRCFVPLIPGLTARYRLVSEGKGSRVVVTCLECGWRRRYMIKSRRGSKRG